jgi:hypothetical protein
MGVGGKRHSPAALPPGKDPVPIVQEAGWAPGPVWTDAEILAPIGIRSPDRPARSQSLYRLSYSGPTSVGILQDKHMKTDTIPFVRKSVYSAHTDRRKQSDKYYYLIQCVTSLSFYSDISIIIRALSVLCAEVNPRIWTSCWQ